MVPMTEHSEKQPGTAISDRSAVTEAADRAGFDSAAVVVYAANRKQKAGMIDRMVDTTGSFRLPAWGQQLRKGEEPGQMFSAVVWSRFVELGRRRARVVATFESSTTYPRSPG